MGRIELNPTTNTWNHMHSQRTKHNFVSIANSDFMDVFEFFFSHVNNGLQWKQRA